MVGILFGQGRQSSLNDGQIEGTERERLMDSVLSLYDVHLQRSR